MQAAGDKRQEPRCKQKNSFLPAVSKIIQHLDLTREFWVAYSGGVDSHVLLHSLVQLRAQHPTLAITAIHVNHGLSLNAGRWEVHCREVCADLSVVFRSEKINLPQEEIKKQGLEAVARKLRYQAFADLLPINAYLFTAHHANDQAETVLLQLFRGCGVNGLAGIAAQAPFAQGWLVRPLLNVSRQDLVHYATRHQLQWIEDESNLAVKIKRNYVRHQLLPAVAKHWPGVMKTLTQAAANAADASELLDVVAEQDWTEVAGEVAATLSVSKLLQLSAVRQRNVLRFWLKQLNLPVPNSLKLAHIQRDVLHCRVDAMPVVCWLGAEMRRYLDNLYAFAPLAPWDSTLEFTWDLKSDLILPSLGKLQVQNAKNAAPVTVRFRRGGEKLRPRGRQETHRLSKLFQEWKVPPWQRDRIPLLFRDDQLLAVVGYCAAANWEKDVVMILN